MLKNCLVAGVTSSGKTVFSRKLVEHYGFSRIPGDALVLAFQQAFPELGIGHEIAGMTDEEAYNSTCRQFGRFLVRFENALSWESSMPYILDTFHVGPPDLAGLDTSKTTVLFFGYPDADAHEKSVQTKEYQTNRYGAPLGWIAEDISAVEDRFRLFIEMSRDLQAQCAAHGFHFINTGISFDQAIQRALDLAISEEQGSKSGPTL